MPVGSSSAVPILHETPRLRLVPETLETLLMRAIGGLRSAAPDSCRSDATLAIEAGRAAGLLVRRVRLRAVSSRG